MSDNVETKSDEDATVEKVQNENDELLSAAAAASSKSGGTGNILPVLNESPAATAAIAVTPTPTPTPAQAKATSAAAISQPEAYNPECLLLADATQTELPLHVIRLLNNIPNAANLYAGELISVLAYACALECGYVAKCHLMQLRHDLDILPQWSFFHTRNLIKLSKYLPPFEQGKAQDQFIIEMCVNIDPNVKDDSFENLSPYLQAQLKCLMSGDFIIITMHSASIGRSVCLSIGRYILANHVGTKTVLERFRNVGKLARELTEMIFTPMRNTQMRDYGREMYPGLDGLPTELYEEIFKFLTLNQINIVANVNKRLNACCQQSRFMPPK